MYLQNLNKFADRRPKELIRKLRPEVSVLHFYKDIKLLNVISRLVPSQVNWAGQQWTSTYRVNAFYTNGWAFSATKAIEAQIYNTTGTHTRLSNQEIWDCVHYTPGRTYITTDAFSYIHKNGVTLNFAYPTSLPTKNRICKRKEEHPRINIKNYYLLQPGDEENLKTSVALIGPISVSIKATGNFFLYKAGVFYDQFCGDGSTTMNHAVLLVGYGTDPALGDFWIIQNNWGNRWGEGGYGKMARNTLFNCGIASAAIYPVVANE